MASQAAPGVSGGWALHRSVTLLRIFLLASAGILFIGATTLGWLLTTSLERQALDDTSTSLTQYVDGVLRPQLVRGDKLHISPHLPLQLKAQLKRQPDLLSVKVWRPDGTLVWTNLAPERIGRRFSSALLGDLGETIDKRRAHASISALSGAENAVERGLGVDHVFEVYAPILSVDGKRALGAYEIYAKPQHTETFIASGKRVIWMVVIAVFAALYTALALLVRKASSTIKRQAVTLRARSQELMDSYRRLEESSLEAIESLNATVDAKDPYTAGHSARVQGIALAVAEELGLKREGLDAIRFGGLFHDIGKIAVPDSILTKPGALDEDECEAIKRHPADGAEIVSHFGRLHDAVPIIRHHHERWDGKGYPDRLTGNSIPQEAFIVGLADAWDAMTSDRPYRLALSVDEAAAEVRRCRGTQFSPVVVDAFFAAFRRRPALFEPGAQNAPTEPDEPYQVAATA
jgi:putative nucleotidyltransferase with HDIG domain